MWALLRKSKTKKKILETNVRCCCLHYRCMPLTITRTAPLHASSDGEQRMEPGGTGEAKCAG